MGNVKAADTLSYLRRPAALHEQSDVRLPDLEDLVMKSLIACCAVVLGFSASTWAQQPETQQSGAEQAQSSTPKFEESIDVRATVPDDVRVAGHPYDHFLTFSEPISIPGATLAPGTYVFHFPLGPGTDVIQVFPANRTEPLAMFQTIPVHDASRGFASTGEVVLKGSDTKGAPLVMSEWYLPGQARGYEFLPDGSAS